jgi:hypothetical protein
MTPKNISMLREWLRLLSAYESAEWADVAATCKIDVTTQQIGALKRKIASLLRAAEAKQNKARVASRKTGPNSLKIDLEFQLPNEQSNFGRWLDLIRSGKAPVSGAPVIDMPRSSQKKLKRKNPT